MSGMRFLLISLLAFFFSACTTPPSSVPQAWLKQGVSVELPSPGITPPISQQQLLTVKVNDKTHSLVTLLDADEHRLVLVGMTTLGIRLFKMIYDGDGIHTEQSIVIQELPPASQVLADIMLSYWPVEAWQACLPPGWTLRDENHRRELHDADNQVVTEIDYAGLDKQRYPVGISQHAFNYQLTIENLDEAP